MNYFATVMTLLRERQQFLEEIRQGKRLNSKLLGLLVSSTAFFAIYGVIIGASSGWIQAILSAIKLPALYLLTLIICFPTLYFFNIMFGSKQSCKQYLALLLMTMAEISVLQLGLAPVALFFMLSTDDYQFFKILNVCILAVTALLGINIFYKGMKFMTAVDSEGAKTRLGIVKLWLVLYAFVGTQLGWTLRPFFGVPGEPFQIFREQDSNFYLNVFQSIGELFQ